MQIGGRKRALCCTPNTQTIQTEVCNYDLCSLIENLAVCDDEAGYNDEEGYTSLLKRSSYVTGDGQTLWTYEDGGVMEENEDHLKAAKSPLPGQSRPRTLFLAKLTGAAFFKGKELVVKSRPYWPGLMSLRGDGKDTLLIRGGYDLLKDACGSTAMKFIPAAQLPKTGYHLEHLREINMLDNFVRSLLSGKLFSGVDMKNKLDPMAVYKGWNKVYDVSLPLIGQAVHDAADYTLPVTPNDRIYETIGSYGYREGVTYLRGPLNILKRTLMMGNSPLGKSDNFHKLLRKVANNGDKDSLKTVLTAMQGTVAVFNYLNDAALHRAFTAAGLTLTSEMKNADEFMPELKGILAAWKEWEPDYYDHVVSLATEWLIVRGGLIAQTFAGDIANNPAALKLVSSAAMILSQVNRIKSPLAP